MSTSECTMSPASHGGLERYVGSCLISATARVKKNQHGPSGTNPGTGPTPGLGPGQGQRQGQYKKVDGEIRGQLCGPHHQFGSPPQQQQTRPYTWSGVPLISVASVNNNRRNRKQSDHHHSPNRQAARPAPNRAVEAENRTPLSRLAIHTQGAPLILAGRYGGAGRKTSHPGPPVRIYRAGDSRRPGVVNGSNGQSGNQSPKSAPSTPSSDSLSVASDESSGHSENSLPRIIKPRKRRKKERKPPPMSSAVTEGVPTVSLKALSDSQDADEPQLLHDFDDVKEADSVFFPLSDASSCQCRYCDPAGLIWDVDRHCYSPFLTPPSPLLFSDLSPSTDLFSRHSDLVLRRSWSEPSPAALSERRTPSPVSSFSPSSSSSLSSVSTQSLEVSSEIVTSHNGHRDIEIKFFSSSATPPVTPPVSFPDTPPPSPAALCSSQEQCLPAKGSIGEQLRRQLSEPESVQ